MLVKFTVIVAFLAILNTTVVAAFATRRLKANAFDPNHITLSVVNAVLLQTLAAVLIAPLAFGLAVASVAIVWVPVWALVKAVCVVAVPIGVIFCLRFYKMHRPPAIVALPLVIGTAALLGENLAVLARMG